MDKEILEVNEAYVALKDDYALIDSSNSLFKLNNDIIIVKNEYSSFKLNKKEFIQLYEDKKFMIYNSDDSGIDYLKDEEYYAFKHK